MQKLFVAQLNISPLRFWQKKGMENQQIGGPSELLYMNSFAEDLHSSPKTGINCSEIYNLLNLGWIIHS
jgi:hypothetical protein